MKLSANYISCETAEDTLIVGFADGEFDPSNFIIFQRALKPTQQDINLGHEKVHIQLSSPKNSCYGTIDKVTCSDKKITLCFNEETATKLSSGQIIEISLDTTKQQFHELIQHLLVLLGDEKVVVSNKREGK